MNVTAKKVRELLETCLADGRLTKDYAELVTLTDIDSTTKKAVVQSSSSNAEYNVSIEKLTPIVMDVSCSCPAGMAGHLCKHVAAVFGCLRDRTTSEQDQKVEENSAELPLAKQDESAKEVTNADIVPIPSAGVAVVQAVMGPEMLSAWRNQAYDIVDTLTKGIDYGTVPGVDKPFLKQPGADLISTAYGVYAVAHVVEKEIDHDREVQWTKSRWVTKPKPDAEVVKTMKDDGIGRNRKFGDKWVWQEKQSTSGTSYGLYRYVVWVDLVHRATGKIVGGGGASCSSLEDKYVEHPRNLENTIWQMAIKRAKVNAVRATFGLSGRFTQDADIVRAEIGS